MTKHKNKPERPSCPKCGSRKVIPIIYGYPSQESIELAEAGEIKIGSIKFNENKPGWHCNNCENEWGTVNNTSL